MCKLASAHLNNKKIWLVLRLLILSQCITWQFLFLIVPQLSNIHFDITPNSLLNYYYSRYHELEGVKWKQFKASASPSCSCSSRCALSASVTSRWLDAKRVRRSFSRSLQSWRAINIPYAHLLNVHFFPQFSGNSSELSVALVVMCEQCSTVTENWPWKVCYSWLRRFIQSPAQPTKGEKCCREMDWSHFSLLSPPPHCDWFASNPCAVAAVCSLPAESSERASYGVYRCRVNQSVFSWKGGSNLAMSEKETRAAAAKAK